MDSRLSVLITHSRTRLQLRSASHNQDSKFSCQADAAVSLVHFACGCSLTRIPFRAPSFTLGTGYADAEATSQCRSQLAVATCYTTSCFSSMQSMLMFPTRLDWQSPSSSNIRPARSVHPPHMLLHGRMVS
ncbi:hypothetical protein LIA77_06551 [Sarocladium implicatum]|nr:hypothetical protein LIA77_06551 [Sarocladium implicatum]